jgi:hypothetical protein
VTQKGGVADVGTDLGEMTWAGKVEINEERSALGDGRIKTFATGKIN